MVHSVSANTLISYRRRIWVRFSNVRIIFDRLGRPDGLDRQPCNRAASHFAVTVYRKLMPRMMAEGFRERANPDPTASIGHVS
jgi:hypothetical protein